MFIWPALITSLAVLLDVLSLMLSKPQVPAGLSSDSTFIDPSKPQDCDVNQSPLIIGQDLVPVLKSQSHFNKLDLVFLLRDNGT